MQTALNYFQVFEKLVRSKIEVNSRVKKELELFSHAPEFVIQGFLEIYQAIHIDKISSAVYVNECDSYIAFALGLTLLNPGNNQAHFPVEPTALADIDSDLANPDLVKDYLREKYGADHIIGIPTYGKYRVKSLLTDLCRVVKDADGEPLVSFDEIKALNKKLPFKIDSQIVADIAENDEDILTGEGEDDEADIFSNPDIQHFGKKYPEIFQHFQKLYALPKFKSMHAAGIVITPQPAREVIPLYLAKKSLCSEFQNGQGIDDLAALGFIKIDLLGLKTLKILDSANHMIMERYSLDENTPSPCACRKQGKECETNYRIPLTIREATGQTLIDLNKLCMNVPLVYKNLTAGKNEGIFQLEPEGISNYTRKFEPKEFYDIALITAAYRPGLMDLKMNEFGVPLDKSDPLFNTGTPGHMMFIERRKGIKKTIYPSEKVKPILESAFGLAVFQENLSQMIMAMTNCGFGEAEKVRKFLTKVKPEMVNTDPDTIAKIKKFYNNYKEKALANGCAQKELDNVWNMILPFARYGFAKSHAVSYSLITFQTAWMRAIFPLEFLTSLMIHNVGNNKKDKIIQYTRTAQNLDFKISKPDINKSYENYTLSATNEIIAGLILVNGVGIKATTEIIRNRNEHGNFTSIGDFLSRDIAWRNVNIGVLSAMAEAGIFDSICPNRKLALTKILINKKKDSSDNYQFIENGVDEKGNIIKEIYIEDFTEKQKKKLERTAFGFDFEDPLMKHIIKYRGFLNQLNELAQQKHKSASIGIVDEIKTFMQKDGKQMARLTVTNIDGNKEQWILFASVWNHLKNTVKAHEAYCILGKKDDKSILADTIKILEDLVPTD